MALVLLLLIILTLFAPTNVAFIVTSGVTLCYAAILISQGIKASQEK